VAYTDDDSNLSFPSLVVAPCSVKDKCEHSGTEGPFILDGTFPLVDVTNEAVVGITASNTAMESVEEQPLAFILSADGYVIGDYSKGGIFRAVSKPCCKTKLKVQDKLRALL
jgi:hypothetical protein